MAQPLVDEERGAGGEVIDATFVAKSSSCAEERKRMTNSLINWERN